MSRWVEPPALELKLWYGDVLVAELRNVFPHQGTWFAPYELKISPGDGVLQDQGDCTKMAEIGSLQEG